MKLKIASICVWISTAFFLGFIGLYIYVLAANPMPRTDKPGIHWPYVTIKHNNPIIVTNYPSEATSIDNPSIHLAIAKDDWNGNLMFFNQEGPCIGALVVSMSNDHSTTETGWAYAGISFRLIKDVRRPDSWWTLMISLWYPLVLFGILPTIVMVKKLRGMPRNAAKM
jgi:hypothetical protein